MKTTESIEENTPIPKLRELKLESRNKRKLEFNGYSEERIKWVIRRLGR